MAIDQVNLNDILLQLREALTKEDWDHAVDIVQALRPADQADVFTELLRRLRTNFCPASTRKIQPIF